MRTHRAVAVTSSLAGLLWLSGPSARAQHQHARPADARMQASAAAPREKEIKIGKKDEVELKVVTIVGDLRLKPGRYQFQHRVDGADHFVHFTEVTQSLPYKPSAPQAHPGDVKCRVELLGKTASTTTLYTVPEGAADRLTRIVIRGENVAHVF